MKFFKKITPKIWNKKKTRYDTKDLNLNFSIFEWKWIDINIRESKKKLSKNLKSKILSLIFDT